MFMGPTLGTGLLSIPRVLRNSSKEWETIKMTEQNIRLYSLVLTLLSKEY
jgi:hypothetical protein